MHVPSELLGVVAYLGHSVAEVAQKSEGFVGIVICKTYGFTYYSLLVI